MDISVIVINYNTARYIGECIDSVLKQENVTKEIFVVDNASADNSIDILKCYKDNLSLIENNSNIGFGRANNLAAKLSKGDFLFLLNPDAAFQSTQDLKHMLDFMKENKEAGIAGTQVTKGIKGGYSIPQVQYPGERYTTCDFSHLPGSIAWVIGASMIIRRDVFNKVGGFDEDFFLYGEEADLCLRIRKQGFSIAYHPLVVVNHVGGASEQNTVSLELWHKKQRGLHLFLQKNYPLAQAAIVVKKQLRRARRKKFFLKIKNCFLKLNERQKNKYDRMNAVIETSTYFLKKKKDNDETCILYF